MYRVVPMWKSREHGVAKNSTNNGKQLEVGHPFLVEINFKLNTLFREINNFRLRWCKLLKLTRLFSLGLLA